MDQRQQVTIALGLAVASWSIVHGLSMLFIDGRVKAMNLGSEQAEAVALRTAQLLGEGLRKR